MTLLLDTSILIGVQRKDKEIIEKIEELKKIHFQPASISFINYFEFYIGLIEKSVKNKQLMLDFINKFNCLKASSITAEILAELKHKYEKKGIVIGLADLVIASHAKENNMLLITQDKIFEKIEEISKIVIVMESFK